MQKFLQNSLFKLLKAKQRAEDAHIKTALSEAPGPANTSNPSSIPTTTKVSSSPVVIRVRGLPLDRQTAKALTEEAITTNLTESTNFRITIIPSCIFSDETVALVDFECLPKFLSSLEINHLDSWETSVHGTDLSFDKHFIGFTQLSDPEGEVQAESVQLGQVHESKLIFPALLLFVGSTDMLMVHGKVEVICERCGCGIFYQKISHLAE